MWEKFIEFSKELLKLKGQVKDNASELVQTKRHLRKLSKLTQYLLKEIERIEIERKNEITLLKNTYDAKIERLEDQIQYLIDISKLSAENGALKVINELQGQMLSSKAISTDSDNSPDKRITEV